MPKPSTRPPETPPRWADQAAAAKYLAVSLRTVEYLIARGQLRAYRLPGRSGRRGMVRVDLNELDAMLAASPVVSARTRT